MMRGLSGLGLWLVLLCHSMVALAVDGPRVAVLEIRGDLPGGQLTLLSDEVRSGILDVTRDMGFMVMSRENMAVLAQDMGLDLDCVEGACEVETGRNLNAAYVVSGHVVEMGDEWICTVKVFDTQKGALLASDRVRAGRPNDFLDGLRGLSGELMASGLGIESQADKDRAKQETAIAEEMLRHEAARRAEVRREQLMKDRREREVREARVAEERRLAAEQRAGQARAAEDERARLEQARREALDRKAAEDAAEARKTRLAEDRHKATQRLSEEKRAAEAADAVGRAQREAARRLVESGRGEMNAVGMVMMSVSTGAFTMGSPEGESGRQPDEAPHAVTLTRKLMVQRTEVTRAQWAAVMGSDPTKRSGCTDACPATHISWMDAARFANALSEREGIEPAYQIYGSTVAWDRNSKGYRMPTESEWEYLARAGTAHIYSGGTEVGEVAWTLGSGGPKAVGQKKENAFGLQDMTGNVHEWCWDLYGAYPSEATDPSGPQVGPGRVFRGGSWRVLYRSARVANRDWMKADLSNDQVGLRLVRTAE